MEIKYTEENIMTEGLTIMIKRETIKIRQEMIIMVIMEVVATITNRTEMSMSQTQLVLANGTKPVGGAYLI
jgi:hypothetical protein